jgi:pimeloyl-ACP methyl ester carboxylesterase
VAVPHHASEVTSCVRSRLIAAVVAALSPSGCWQHIDDHCPGCTVLSERAPDLPRLREDTPATVLLVHGAFGFGDEWDAVVAALQKGGIDFVAWSWRGPWRSPSRSAARFTAVLQGMLDALPAGVTELLVIAHSAGGALAENAVPRVRVPEGKRLRVLAIEPARANLSAPRDRRFSDQALAQTLSVGQRPLDPVPPRVSVEEYFADDAPSAPRADEPGFHRVFLGAHVDHNEAVRLVALPAVERMGERMGERTGAPARRR